MVNGMNIYMEPKMKQVLVEAYNNCTWGEGSMNRHRIQEEAKELKVYLTLQTNNSDSNIKSGYFEGRNVTIQFLNENGVFGDTCLIIRLYNKHQEYCRQINLYGADVELIEGRLVMKEQERVGGSYAMMVVI